MRAACVLAIVAAGCASSSSPEANGVVEAPPPRSSSSSSGTDASPPAPVDDTPDPLIVDRPYSLFAPTGIDDGPPAPLVLAFHGYGDGDDGPTLEKFFELKPVAAKERFFYVTPDGTKDKTGQRFWNGTDACCNFFGSKVDDVAYVRALVADVAKHHAVDPKRVYAVGLSGGGFFVHRLACDASDVFAAVISMSGATFAKASSCLAKDGVAVVELHGDKDENVLYAGSADGDGLAAGYPSAKDTVAMWAKRDGCPGDLVSTGTTLDLFTMPGAETSVARYEGCPRGAVELWTVNGGPHAPLMNAGFGAAVWSFFAAHPKP